MNIMPQTVSSKDIQTSYRKIFDAAKQSREPIIVLKNNKPEVAIVSLEQLNYLYEKAEGAELKDALNSIGVYKKEQKSGKLKDLESLEGLLSEN